MTLITLPIMKAKPGDSVTGAMMLRTAKEPYSAVTQTSLVKMNLNTPAANFIKNAHPAFVNQTHFMETSPTHVFVLVIQNPNTVQSTPYQWLEKRKKWRNLEYRQSYMEAAIEQGVAWQIKTNRERRGLSQKELASRITSKQSAISRAEDPSYGRHRLETLVKIANAFDCALQVKFIPYSQLAKDSDDLSPDALYAKSYIEEVIP